MIQRIGRRVIRHVLVRNRNVGKACELHGVSPFRVYLWFLCAMLLQYAKVKLAKFKVWLVVCSCFLDSGARGTKFLQLSGTKVALSS